MGALPLSIQARLLRAVEQGEIEPVGGEPVQVDVRLVAATNQDLPRLSPRAASAGIYMTGWRCWRSICLRYGNGAKILCCWPAISPRRRPGAMAGGYRCGSPSAARRLEGHRWPGNVRELKNVVTRAVLLNTVVSSEIRYPLHFSPPGSGGQVAIRSRISLPARAGPTGGTPGEEGGNISALSRRLRVCTKTIYRWLRSEYH